MRLAAKLVLALVLGILAVMGAYAWLQVRHEITLYERDIHPPPRGRGFLALMQSVYRTDGEKRVRDLVEEAAEIVTDVEVRWRRTNVPPDDPKYPKDPAAAREAVASGTLAVATVHDEPGDAYRYHYLPVEQGNPLVLEVSASLERELSFIQTSHRMMALTTFGIVLVCAGIAAILGIRLVGRPLQRVRDQAQRMGAGDYSGRLSLRQHDEIGDLAADMNILCERLDEATHRLAAESEARQAAFEQLRHSDRLATIGQLASGIAHDLGTPLSVVAGRAGLVANDPAVSEEAREHARIVVEQAGRMADSIRQLLDFSRRRRAQPVPADLRDVASRTLALVTAVGGRHHVRFELETDGPATARLDETQIQQALTNVVLNAVQAMPDGGCVHVTVGSERHRPPGGAAPATYRRVEVWDEGPGIAPEHLPHIFEPFFTTKPSGEGTGLGLSVARGILEEHGGWIEAENAPGGGARFRLYVPALEPSAAVQEAS